MTMTPSDLRSYLQVLKEFDITNVSFEIDGCKLTCNLPSKIATTLANKRQPVNFPEAAYNKALQSDVTEAEMRELGFAGVKPQVRS